MIQRLREDASGLRHLRWAREILATIEAHHEHDPRLGVAARDALLAEIVVLRQLVIALSAAVKPYRDYLERERTRFRGMVRVGRYLVESARTDDEKAEGLVLQRGFDEIFATIEARERLPRKEAVREAVRALHEGLAAMDERLSAFVSPALVESLYPELAKGGTRVADVGDEDDDATATR